MSYSAGEQEVKSLIVECKKSCGWSGELRLAKTHEKNDCPNALIPCPNWCNNGSTRIIRKNVETHVLLKCPNRLYACTECHEEIKFRNVESHDMVCPRRQYTCPHCNEAGVYDERTTSHLTVCSKVEVRCSKCWGQILRCNKSKHHLVCPNEPVRCKYYNIGCGEKLIRENVPKHEAENAQIHLELATEEVLRLKNILILKNTLTFQTNYSKLENTSIQSPPFYTSKKGYKICISIYPNGQSGGAGTHVSVYACLMKGDHDDTLTWPFTGSVTIELLNQLEDKNHYKGILAFIAHQETSKRVVDRERGPGRGYTTFISHAALGYNASANTQYLKDDTLVFRVSAEAPDSKPWLECTN